MTVTQGSARTGSRNVLDMRDVAAARWLVADFLRQGRLAFRRVQAGNDATALHDFRVALRRLRSTLRAYRRELRGVIPRSVRTELRDIARSTGRTRDIEVQIEWLAAQRPAGDDVKSAIAWLLEILKVEQARIVAEEQESSARFSGVAAAIARALRKEEEDLHQASAAETFAGTAARQIRSSARELRDFLELVTGVRAQDELHAARIEGKRLRYVLEPVAAVDNVKTARLIDRLKNLQDTVGEMRDLQLLRVYIEQLLDAGRAAGDREGGTAEREKGMGSLVVQLSNAEQRLWRQFRSRWNAAARKSFFSQISSLVGQLHRREALMQSDLEIERKYLLKSLPPRVHRAKVLHIDQGWVPGTKFVERLRRVRTGSATRGRVQYFRTVKLGSGLTRMELEEKTTAAVFNTMWPLTEGKRVSKKRYRVRDGVFVWEIDEFTDRKLYLAEIELPDPDTQVELPAWLKRYVAREVTDEPRYVNRNLAR